eukprot:gene8325-149_t
MSDKFVEEQTVSPKRISTQTFNFNETLEQSKHSIVEKIKKYKTNSYKDYLYYIKDDTLYFTDISKKKYEYFSLKEGPKKFEYCFQDVIYGLKIYFEEGFILVHFEKFPNFQQFLESLKVKGFVKQTNFLRFSHHLENGKLYKKWKSIEIIQWLTLIFVKKDTPLSSIFEEVIHNENIEGKDLEKFITTKNLLRYNNIDEKYKKLLTNEFQKLQKNSKILTNEMKFNVKLSNLIQSEEDEEYYLNDRNMLLSLCSSTDISDSYLNPKPTFKLHQNFGSDLSNSIKTIKIRLIISEMVHSQSQSGLSRCTSGMISSIPFIDLKSKFGSFKCALIVGPFYLEFADSSIIVPKRIHPIMKKLFSKFSSIVILNETFNEITEILSNFIADWNSNYTYQAFQPNLKKKESNGFTFVEEFLSKIAPNFKGFQGSLSNFLAEMKDFGDSGPSIFPDVKSNFSEKFKFGYIKDAVVHSKNDNALLSMFDIDENFDKNHPHDFLVFQVIDAALWIRFFKTGNLQFSPKMSLESSSNKIDIQEYLKGSICPCFSKKLFVDLMILSSNKKVQTTNDYFFEKEELEEEFEILSSIKDTLKMRNQGDFLIKKTSTAKVTSDELDSIDGVINVDVDDSEENFKLQIEEKIQNKKRSLISAITKKNSLPKTEEK